MGSERLHANATKMQPEHQSASSTPPSNSRTSHTEIPALGAAGNLALGRALAARSIRAKLEVSQPGDPDEEEADRVADQVMRMAEPGPLGQLGREVRLQRKCEACEVEERHEAGEHGQEEALRRKEDGPRTVAATSKAVNVPRMGGEKLDAETRAFMEPRFGFDFSQVRIHADDQAADSAARIHARAYTVGSKVVFGAGQFSPRTPDGQRLLAHELTHVVQQRGADVQPHVQRGIIPGALRNDEGTPEQIADAIKNNDAADVKAINDFTQSNPKQKHQLLEILLAQDWLAYWDRRAVARIFNSFGDLESIDEASVAILKRCVTRGFDMHALSRYDNFAFDLKAELKRAALQNLGDNITLIQTEAARLGVAEGQGPAIAEQKAAIEEQQRLAHQVGDAKKMMFAARKIVVGQYGPLSQPAENAWKPVMFDPEKPPVESGILPVKEANAAKHEMPWDQVYAQYAALAKAVTSVLNENPALYALTTLLEDAPGAAVTGGGEPRLNFGQQRIAGFDILSQEAAREKVRQALTDVYNNARLTMAKTMAGSLNPLQFHSLVARAKGGDLGGRWNRPYTKCAIDAAVLEAESSFDKTMAQIGLALLLASVAIGTAGGATPVLGAIIAAANVGTAAAGAAIATLNAQDLDRASQSNVNDKTSLVSPQQAAKAQLDALLYQFGAIVAVAGEAAAALLSVGKASVGLTNFQILDQQDKAAALSGALRDLEVGQVALRTGLPPEEMMQLLAARSVTDAEAAAGVSKIREFLNQMKGPLIGPTAGGDKTVASLLRQAKMTIAEYWNRVQGLGFRQVDSVSLHGGFGDAELTYIKLIEDTPGREAGIYRNATTGEHAIVQGKGNWSTFGEVSHMEALPEAAGQRWILVEHYHPERNFAVQFPSGRIGPNGPTGDFAVLLHDFGETNIAGVLQGQKSTRITQRVEATIRYRDPKTGTYYFTTYGYDPGRHAIGSFFVTAKTESGALVDYSFRDIARLAGARSEYERHMAGITKGQPIVKAVP